MFGKLSLYSDLITLNSLQSIWVLCTTYLSLSQAVSLSMCFMIILLSAFTFLFYSFTSTFSFLKCFKSSFKVCTICYNSLFFYCRFWHSFLICLIQFSLSVSKFFMESVSALSLSLSVSESSKFFQYSICMMVFFSSRLSFNLLRLLIKLIASLLLELFDEDYFIFDYDYGLLFGFVPPGDCVIFVRNLPQDWLALALHLLMLYYNYFSLFLRSIILYLLLVWKEIKIIKGISLLSKFPIFIISARFINYTNPLKKLARLFFTQQIRLLTSSNYLPLSPHLVLHLVERRGQVVVGGRQQRIQNIPVQFVLQYQKNNMNKPFYGVASMPKSQRSKIIQVHNGEVPGPGSYDFNKEKSHNELPKWSLKKRLEHGSCFENLSFTPAPGVYQPEPQYPSKSKQPIKNNFEKGDKYRHFVQKTYTHSHLNLPGSLNLKAGHSFGYREVFREVQRSPGPIYHLDETQEEKRRQKIQNSYRGFGFGQKNIIYKGGYQSPGPGHFYSQPKDFHSTTSESWTFGLGKRNQQNIGNPLGPGQYDPKMMTLTRSFKLRGKNANKMVIENNTGPGSYDIPDTKTKIGTRFKSPKVDQKLNERLRDREEEENISPFTYNPPRYLERMDSNGFSLGMKLPTDFNTGQDHPGPGAYEINQKKEENRGGYMGRKIDQKMKENAMDNFYKYDPKIASVARQSPKFTFSQSKRLDDKQNNKTSPYCQQFYQSINMKSTSSSYSMGTSKRFADLKKDAGPFKSTPQNYSTIGNLPVYLKKNCKKKA